MISMQDPRTKTAGIVLACIALATVFAFWIGLSDLALRWNGSPELSHSPFLPAVAAWFLWERKDALTKSLGAPALAGLIPIAFALFLLFLGTLTHILVLVHLGFVTFICALPLALGGWSLWRVMIVPLAYLYFMVPPPYWVITVMSGKFQLMSSALGVALIRLFDIPVFLSGNVIHLPTETLQVVEACSGLRYLFPFLSLGAIAGYLYQGPMWQRLLIVVSTIPITIAMNSFRIAVTGVLVENYGTSHTEGALHFFEGWVVFLMCIGLLLALIWVMTLLRGKKGAFAYLGFDEVEPAAPTGQWTTARFTKLGVAVTAMLLAAGIVVHTVGNRSLIFPERQDFSTLLFEFPDWKSRTSTLNPEVAETLGADDYIIADMESAEGDPINLYIAYLLAQRDGRSWHSPMQCLPGGGWEIVEQDIRETTRLTGEPYHYNRMIIQQGEDRLLVHYWYDQRGRKMASEFTIKFAVMWDSLVRQRADGAMVRLMTPILPNEGISEAEARIERMKAELEPKLPAYVPH